jgi:hypothetical protein
LFSWLSPFFNYGTQFYCYSIDLSMGVNNSFNIFGD